MSRYWKLQIINLTLTVFDLFKKNNRRDKFSSPVQNRILVEFFKSSFCSLYNLLLPWKINYQNFWSKYKKKHALRTKGQKWDREKGEGCKNIMTWFSQPRWCFYSFYRIAGRWKKSNPKSCSLCLTRTYQHHLIVLSKRKILLMIKVLTFSFYVLALRKTIVNKGSFGTVYS